MEASFGAAESESTGTGQSSIDFILISRPKAGSVLSCCAFPATPIGGLVLPLGYYTGCHAASSSSKGEPYHALDRSSRLRPVPGGNQRSNSAAGASRVIALAARATARTGASTLIRRTLPRQATSQQDGTTTASAPRRVRPSRMTCGSHDLYAGQVTAARPRRGQGDGARGGLLSRHRRGRIDFHASSAKEGLVAAIVLEAQKRPAERDGKPGERPAEVTERSARPNPRAKPSVRPWAWW